MKWILFFIVGYRIYSIEWINEFILLADTRSIVLQTHTVYITQVDKNRQNIMFYNGIGGWIQGLQTHS